MRYQVTWLGNLGGESYASSVNNSGHVAGWASTNDPVFSLHAFLWDGTMHDICRGQAYGINANDHVVGQHVYGVGDSAGFLYDGVVHDLPGFNGQIRSFFPTIPTAINDNGQIAGSFCCCYVSTVCYALLRDPGPFAVWRDLGGHGDAHAAAISSNGLVAGSDGARAFVYDGIMHLLGTLPGTTQSWAASINGAGEIVGNCNAPANPRAFLYSNGAMRQIGCGFLNGDYANGINDSGHVVGTTSQNCTGGPGGAFLYADGALRYLTDLLVDSPGGWRIDSANAISNSGFIAAIGTNPNVAGGVQQALLLTPVPCTADFNHDDIVDFFDYLDFVAALDAEDASADFNGDNTVDFFDYLDFVQAFDAGCD
jgi:probable HAF family extracellular repeat protein